MLNRKAGAENTMSSQNEHDPRVAGFPDDIRNAHRHSSRHRAEIAGSALCGCFCCCETFPPGEIGEWVDDVDGVGQTALCPMCGIDAVIGDGAGFALSQSFLETMRRHWF